MRKLIFIFTLLIHEQYSAQCGCQYLNCATVTPSVTLFNIYYGDIITMNAPPLPPNNWGQANYSWFIIDVKTTDDPNQSGTGYNSPLAGNNGLSRTIDPLEYLTYGSTTGSFPTFGYFMCRTLSFPFSGSSNNCFYGRSFKVNFLNVPDPVLNTPNQITVCQGDSVQLSASASVGQIVWRIGSATGNVIGTGNNLWVTPNSNTVYYSTAKNGTSSYSNQASVTSSNAVSVSVNVISKPSSTITASGSTMLCQGGSVLLNANTGTGLTYQWKNNGTNINGATSASYTATTAGSYTLVVTNSNGCSATSTATSVTVNAIPTATITAGGATSFCQGGSVVLNANTGAGLTYQWKNNGTNINGATSASYTATTAGSYTVVVTNSNGCSATSSATSVTVNALPIVTISVGGTTTFCQGDSVLLNANTGTGLTYQWKNNGTNISGATNATYSANSAGTYSVVVTNTNGCSSSSSATTVIVNTLPIATISVGGTTTFCQGDSVLLNANTGTGLTYQWNNNGTNISGATNATYSANAAGSYTIVVTNGNGCSSNASQNLVVIDCNDLGTDNLNIHNQIILYPNPASNNINVLVIEDFLSKSFIICDLNGRALIMGELKDHISEINIDSLSAGVYYFKLAEFNHKLKFVKAL